jgi:membrane protein DedA with SNARE-associated domain
VNRIIDLLSGLHPPWAYVAVGLLATAEAAALIGLIVPGELAMLWGGFVASQGRANLLVMMACAVLGGVVGDSIGFELGSRFGPALQGSRLGQMIGDERWEKAESALRRGPSSVFVARFVGLLRAVTPAAAGMSDLAYRTFFAWNVAGGLVWGVLAVGGGYLAGDAYRRLGTWFTVGAVAIAIVAGAVVLVRHHQRG